MAYTDFEVHREFEEFTVQIPSDDVEAALDDGKLKGSQLKRIAENRMPETRFDRLDGHIAE